MSIASEITRLQNIKAAIRQALVNKGIAAASSHDMADFAADIGNIATGATLQSKRVSASTSEVTTVTPDSGYDGLSEVKVNMILRQSKTVTPSTSDQTVSPDTGYQGLSSVTVEGDADLVAGNIKSGVDIFGVTGSYAPASVSLQTKSVTPSASAQTVVADSGYDGLSQVNVAATPLETKSVTPSASAQTVTPSSGKVGLSQVNVAAAPLETKSVTPSASQQIITPSSGKIGMSQVTVAGDADLIASNIKSGVEIFGVTGSYAPSATPVNGSLIEVTCSSNIDAVTATVNGNTYDAYVSGGKAYITIPYTDTTAARTCVLKGYASGAQVTAANVSMANGVGYYTAQLSTSAWLFRNGTWTGVESHEWIRIAPSAYAGRITVTESDVLTMVLSSSVGSTQYAWVYLSPKLNNRGYSQLEIVLDSKLTSDPIYVYCGASPSSEQSPGRQLSIGTNIIPLTVDDFYLEFYMNDWNTRVANEAAISSIRFV